MQNLSISCSLVCLIILGSAALVGAFGVCQRQISAVLVTGVMYLLAGEYCTSGKQGLLQHGLKIALQQKRVSWRAVGDGVLF